MCGPSAAQNTVQQNQIDLSNQVMAQNSTVYGESQSILNSLNSAFQPILAAGPNQTGFSDAESTSLNTQATEQTAQNFNQAKKEMQDNEAASGGGNNFIPSGSASSNEEALAATGAAAQSSEQQQILQQNYATGRQNFYQAAGELGNVASTLNPTGTTGNAISAGSSAASTANTIAAQGNSIWTSVLGALGGVAGAAAGGYTSGLAKQGG
jgi:hypothetical protein